MDLAELGRLRCFDAGGDGVGSEPRPSLDRLSIFIVANERLVPTFTEAMALNLADVFLIAKHE